MERKFLPRKLANSRVFPSSSPSLSFSLLFSFLFFLELTLPRLVPSSSFFISCPLSPRDASKSYCVPGDREFSPVWFTLFAESTEPLPQALPPFVGSSLCPTVFVLLFPTDRPFLVPPATTGDIITHRPEAIPPESLVFTFFCSRCHTDATRRAGDRAGFKYHRIEPSIS